jgi:hypothetical protein
MGEILAFGTPFAVVIVWVIWRIISIKIPYVVEQIIQYVWLFINAVLLLVTHEYWNMLCFMIIIGAVFFSLSINTELGILIFGHGRESAYDKLDERRFFLKTIDDILMDANIVAIFIQIALILIFIIG